MIDGAHFRCFEAEEDGTTIAIGGLLGATAAHVLPVVVLAGYLVRVFRAGFDGDDGVPAFDHWTRLFRDGLGAAAVALPYQIPPALALLATIGFDSRSAMPGLSFALAEARYGLAGAGFGFGGGAYYGSPDLAFAAGAVATAVLELAFSYLTVAAIANYARTGSVLAGFDVRRVYAASTRPRNAALCGACALVLFGIGIARAAVGAVPVVGPLLASALAFYGVVVAARILSDGYVTERPPARDGRDAGPVVAPE